MAITYIDLTISTIECDRCREESPSGPARDDWQNAHAWAVKAARDAGWYVALGQAAYCPECWETLQTMGKPGVRK